MTTGFIGFSGTCQSLGFTNRTITGDQADHPINLVFNFQQRFPGHHLDRLELIGTIVFNRLRIANIPEIFPGHFKLPADNVHIFELF